MINDGRLTRSKYFWHQIRIWIDHIAFYWSLRLHWLVALFAMIFTSEFFELSGLFLKRRLWECVGNIDAFVIVSTQSGKEPNLATLELLRSNCVSLRTVEDWLDREQNNFVQTSEPQLMNSYNLTNCPASPSSVHSPHQLHWLSFHNYYLYLQWEEASGFQSSLVIKYIEPFSWWSGKLYHSFPWSDPHSWYFQLQQKTERALTCWRERKSCSSAGEFSIWV